MTYFKIRVLEIAENDGVHIVEGVEAYTIMPEEYEKIKKFAESLMGERAEQLVRCKDCAYWQDDWELASKAPDCHYCSMNDTAFYSDEYCSRGERKDEVTE